VPSPRCITAPDPTPGSLAATCDRTGGVLSLESVQHRSSRSTGVRIDGIIAGHVGEYLGTSLIAKLGSDPQSIRRSTCTSCRGSRHAGTGSRYLLTGKPITG
jgi:hypothetical protein